MQDQDSVEMGNYGVIHWEEDFAGHCRLGRVGASSQFAPGNTYATEHSIGDRWQNFALLSTCYSEPSNSIHTWAACTEDKWKYVYIKPWTQVHRALFMRAKEWN